ncbi:DUF3866 family protein [Dermabacteraceae bacterium TAE3-ERU5]|nr:DUF3866 family protein [Dermabacteraceae bacterium TAE3-ERU5]
MIYWERGRVSAEAGGWPGVQRVWVETQRGRVRALSYLELTGPVYVGETVVLNSSAQERGLGTGGDCMIVAVEGRSPADKRGSGHLVKARYTPCQVMVDAVDDPDSPHHETMARADSLTGMPVVVADLHSALPAIVAAVRHAAPRTRIAYLMTDGAALPAWYSRAARELRERGDICAIVTCGQAYGGDVDAVTLHSGLLAARHVSGADVTVCVQGPGNLGSATRYGFSGVQVAEAIHACTALGGRAVGSLRVSGADARDRHLGLSHHCLTAYGRLCLAGADLVEYLPGPDLTSGENQPGTPPAPGDEPLPERISREVSEMLAVAEQRGVRHRLVRIADPKLPEVLANSPVKLSTMGRGYADDPYAFLYAAAAGSHAAALIQ